MIKIFQLLENPEEENKDSLLENEDKIMNQPYLSIKPGLKGGTTNFDENLQTVTPEEVLNKPYLEDYIEEENGEEPKSEVQEEIIHDKDYPKFPTAFQAFRWAKQNRQVVRIYYYTIKGIFIIRDIEPHGDFWARTTLKRILVTWDETVGAIRAFRLENVQKYEFKGETFTPKFNFSQRQHNYRKRIKNRAKNKSNRKQVKLMNSENRVKNAANYGVLEKDKRIPYISNILKEDIYNTISKVPDKDFGKIDIENKVNINISPKHVRKRQEPFIKNVPIIIRWKIEYKNTELKETFLGGAASTLDPNYKTINSYPYYLYISINSSASKNDFLKEADIKLNIILNHEVKHILDIIDGIIYRPYEQHKKYYDYLTHPHEFDAYIVSAIENMKDIFRKYPNISFEEALEKNHIWTNVIKNVLDRRPEIIKYTNKAKTKLAYFWNTMQKRFTDKKDLSVLKRRLARLVYILHKDNPEYSHQNVKYNIETYCGTEKKLEEAIEKIKEKIQEQGIIL